MAKHAVATMDELLQHRFKLVAVNGLEVGIYLVGDELYAWRNVCPHAGAPVCRGRVGGTRLPSGVYEYEYGRDGEILRCPWHGWEFDLRTGDHLVPTGTKLKGYRAEREGNVVYLVV